MRVSILAVALLMPATSLAAPVEKTTATVGPVFHSKRVDNNNPNTVYIGGGDYSIEGPVVSVPTTALNNRGANGTAAEPSEDQYTALRR